MITLVGLGNPDDAYKETRHNVGRMIAEFIHHTHAFSEWSVDKKKEALVSKGVISGAKVEIVLPQTYMNKSGKSVIHLQGSIKKTEQMIVIQDDLDMPLGSVKMIFNRGSGGHKGIESIERAVKSKSFIRIKIGISKATPTGKVKKPKGDDAVTKYVLGKFSPDEMKVIGKIKKAVSASLETYVVQGRDRAMTELNGRY